MSKASEVKLSRYSLRPKVSAFDLCINQNRYGLVRHTIGRQAKIIPAQCKTTKRELSPTPDSSPSQSRTPSPLPLINKRKIRFQTVENIDAKKTCNAPIVTVPKIWQLPVRTQTVCKPPTILYDVSKGNRLEWKTYSIIFVRFNVLIYSIFFLSFLIACKKWRIS